MKESKDQLAQIQQQIEGALAVHSVHSLSVCCTEGAGSPSLQAAQSVLEQSPFYAAAQAAYAHSLVLDGQPDAAVTYCEQWHEEMDAQDAADAKLCWCLMQLLAWIQLFVCRYTLMFAYYHSCQFDRCEDGAADTEVVNCIVVCRSLLYTGCRSARTCQEVEQLKASQGAWQ